MEQINNALLNMLQELTRPRDPMPLPGQSDSKQSQFKDMMNQAQQSHPKDQPAKNPVSSEHPDKLPPQEAPQDAAIPTGKDLLFQNQMALAAMAVLSAPVVPMDLQVLAADPAVTAPVAAQMVSSAVLPVETAPLPVEAQQSQTSEMTPAAAPLPTLEQPVPAQADPSAPLLETEATMDPKAQTVSDPLAQQKVSVEEKNPLLPNQEMADGKDVEKTVVELGERSLFGEVESTPIKVGETEASQKSAQPEPVEKQLLKSLTKALKQGDSKVEIQLNPSHLGSVKVELTRHADGALQVILSAEHTHTQALLDKHVLPLQHMLADQNQEPVRVVVQQQEAPPYSTDDQRSGGQGGHPQEQRQQQKSDSQDFLHQLRLGLTPLEESIF